MNTSQQATQYADAKHPEFGMQLLNTGLITQAQLDHAQDIQRRCGGALADILISRRYISPEELQDYIAATLHLERAGNELDFSYSNTLSYSVAKKYKAVIINASEDKYTIAVCEALNDNELSEIENHLDKPVVQVLATEKQFEEFWETVYRNAQIKESTYKLHKEQPQNSAHRTLSTGQKITGLILLISTVALLILDYKATLLVINIIAQIIYATLSLFKFAILWKGHKERNQLCISPELIAGLDERDLPIYTLLIPVYKEAEIVPLIVERLSRLDYPAHKLDIRILLEEDDEETQNAFKQYDLPPQYTLLVVPDSQPRTKPKACNYGLLQAKGDYVVIYDAEDMPEPDQLKKVYIAFRDLPEECVCVQAKLNYYNSTQNLLTRWFTHEYSTWFDVLLVGVMAYEVPLPLGGTSNHFKTQLLREIGAWDPFNVTEDADLGIRLHKLHYKTAVLDSYTFEEATSKTKNWIRQRSRWIKGYLQTWLVHMRSPIKLLKTVGAKGFIGFQAMMLGTPLIPLLNPFFWALTIIWYLYHPAFIHELFPGALYYIASVQLILGNFIFIFTNLIGTYSVIRDGEEKGKMHLSYSLVLSTVLTPIYWIMMSFAAYLALIQLITRPHYWEKTDHGLTDQVTHNPVTADGCGDVPMEQAATTS